MSAKALRAAVLALPEEERADLVDEVVSSLPLDVDLERAWAEEADRRLDAWERGEVKGVPAAEVHARVRERLRAQG